MAREASGELHRWERAYHVALHYQAASPETLLRGTDRYWGDGFAAPFVVAAVPAAPELALRCAAGVLDDAPAGVTWQRSTSRLARLTAIGVLAGLGTPAARERLKALDRQRIDPHLRAHVQRALSGPALTGKDLQDVTSLVLAGSAKEDRALAIERLTTAAATEAIGVVRAALRDRTVHVRKHAAYGLAALGDTGSLDTFVTWLESEDHEAAKIGAHAIGYLGDLRGAGPILAALGRGFSPSVVGEALERLGPWVLGPLLDVVERAPELARRASVSSVVKTFPCESTAATVSSWVADVRGDPDHTAQRALLGLEVTSGRADVVDMLLGWLAKHHGDLVAAETAGARALKKKIGGIERRKAKKARPETPT
ncbi:MAG: HEAT repeat domain-containing protein [Polyangiaceae bacterium]